MSGVPSRIEVAGRHRIRHAGLVRHAEAGHEAALPVVDVDHERRGGFVADREVDPAVAVDVGGGSGTPGRVRGTERRRPREAGLAVVEVDPALPAVAARDGEIDEPVLVEIGGYDRRRRLRGNRDARRREASATLVETHVARTGAVGGHDIRPAVAVQVDDGGVARGPRADAPGAGDREPALPVVQVDQLFVGRVVAREDVEIAVAIQVRERRGVGPIGLRAQVRCDEPALAVVEEHAIEQRLMPALGQHQVEIPVAVEIAHAHVGRILGRRFEEDDLAEVPRGTRRHPDCQKARDEGDATQKLDHGRKDTPAPIRRGASGTLLVYAVDGTLARCDPFGIPSTSPWTGAAIIVKASWTKTCIVTPSRISAGPMPSSSAG